MAFLNPNFLAQGIVDSFDQTAVTPAAEVFPDIAVRREVVGQKPPSAAGAGLVEDSVPDFAQGVLRASPPRAIRRQLSDGALTKITPNGRGLLLRRRCNHL